MLLEKNIPIFEQSVKKKFAEFKTLANFVYVLEIRCRNNCSHLASEKSPNKVLKVHVIIICCFGTVL